MADPLDLAKAFPYGLFDKRTWSSKARDAFSKQLLEEEATRLYDRQSKLQAESAAQQREIQKAYQQNAYDLARAKSEEERGRYHQGVYHAVSADIRKNTPGIDAAELDAIARDFADNALSQRDAGEGAEQAKRGAGSIATLGTEADIAAAKAEGELAQAQLAHKRDTAAIEKFAAEQEALDLSRKAKNAENKEIISDPSLAFPSVLNALSSYNNAIARTPLIQSQVLKNNADAAKTTEDVNAKKVENAIRERYANPGGKPKAGALPVLRLDANGNLQEVGVSNSVPTAVSYDAPGSLQPLLTPSVMRFINRTNLLNQPK